MTDVFCQVTGLSKAASDLLFMVLSLINRFITGTVAVPVANFFRVPTYADGFAFLMLLVVMYILLYVLSKLATVGKVAVGILIILTVVSLITSGLNLCPVPNP